MDEENSKCRSVSFFYTSHTIVPARAVCDAGDEMRASSRWDGTYMVRNSRKRQDTCKQKERTRDTLFYYCRHQHDAYNTISCVPNIKRHHLSATTAFTHCSCFFPLHIEKNDIFIHVYLCNHYQCSYLSTFTS